MDADTRFSLNVTIVCAVVIVVAVVVIDVFGLRL